MEAPTFVEEINASIIKLFDKIHEYEECIQWHESGCKGVPPEGLYGVDPTSDVVLFFMNMCRFKLRLHELLVFELRKSRDNGDAFLVHTFSRGKDWNQATPEEQQRVEQCWVNLNLLTLKIDKKVLYVHSDSPNDWKEQTKQWISKYNLM